MKWQLEEGKWMRASLPNKVKKQYVQLYNIVDTSIKHQISGHSTSMLKGCMRVCLI